MGILASPSFSVLGRGAARAVVAATAPPDGPVSVVADGAVTASQAARIGSRWPIPLVGRVGGGEGVAAALGAPVPDHVLEIIHRRSDRRRIDAEAVLGMTPERSTVEVVRALYEWATVLHLRQSEAAA